MFPIPIFGYECERSYNLFFQIHAEPVGRVPPKFASASSISGAFHFDGNTTLAMLCPAQAFPAPMYRWGSFRVHNRMIVLLWQTSPILPFRYETSNVSYYFNPIFLSWYLHPINAEPVGRVSPKFASASRSSGDFQFDGNSSFALLCPAQAFPAPMYR